MKTKILRTDKEYEEASNRIYELIHSSEDPIEPNTPEGDELELLSLLVEKYEQSNYRIDQPDPVEAIKFRMDQMKLKQSEIAPLFGGKTRVSEVLNKRRPLSLKMITLINRYLGVPLESLIAGNKEIKLEPEKREKLMNVPSIKDYLTSSREIASHKIN